MKSGSISAILLAAGGSSRLGQPKQLLKIGSTSLIRKLAGEALASRADEVVVVVGFESQVMRDELKGLNLNIVDNSDWESGLSSSIAAGLKAVSRQCEGALFMLCDQPHVTRDLLNLMIERFQSKRASVVACEYAQTVGIPALFSKSLFPNLFQLEGNSGAKSVILSHGEKVERIAFPGGTVDIDVPDDLKGLPG